MQVTIKKAKNLLRGMIEKGVSNPIMLHSSPGVGKSSIIKQLAQETGSRFVDVRLSSMESSDVQGIPFVDNGIMKFSTPSWFPEDTKEKVVLFFDELSNASIDVQKAAYRIILDREIHNGKRLGDNVVVFAAGNLKSDRTGAKDLVPALANRFAMHIDVVPSLEDFVEYAYGAGIDDRVIGFLNWKPDALYRFDPKNSGNSFPTPRSWEAFSELLQVADDEDIPLVASSSIGEGVAHEFGTFVKYIDKLPNMKDIVEGNIDYKVDSNDRGILFALTSSIISAIREYGESDEAIRNIFKVVAQMDDDFIAIVYRNVRYMDSAMLVRVSVNTTETWKRVSKHL